MMGIYSLVCMILSAIILAVMILAEKKDCPKKETQESIK